MSLTDKTKKSTYKDLIIIDNGNAGFDSNLKVAMEHHHHYIYQQIKLK